MKKQKTPSVHALRWLFANTKGQRGRIAFLVVSNAIGSLLSVVFALVSRALVDSATGGNAPALVRNAVALGALILGQMALSLATRAVTEYVSVRLRLHFQNRTIAQLMEKEFSAVVPYHSGELLTRVFSDVGIATDGMVNLLPAVAALLTRLISATVVLFAIAPQFTLLLIAAGALVSGVALLTRKYFKAMHKRMQEALGRVRSFMQEMLERLLVIKVFNAEAAVQHKNQGLQEEYFRMSMKRRAVGMISSTGFGLIFQAGYFLAMLWGCWGILHGVMTYGTLTAMLQLVGQVQQPLSGFSGLISHVFTMTASAERMIELENLPQEPAQEAVDYADLQGIHLKQVDFTYGRNQVLTGVNATIRRGDMVSITGISGSGKSTLFLLLLGAYKPTAGSIEFDFGSRVTAPGQATRKLFAYVPQGNYLMSGTLRENLTFFREGIPEEALWQALETACAADFVRELPSGLDTLLGEKGHGLSEGQMQRIAVARALLSGAPILLLDEATSALDEATEALLLQNIAALQHRTCLIVTHRRPALAICNRHLVIRDDRVSEDIAGYKELTHDEG